MERQTENASLSSSPSSILEYCLKKKINGHLMMSYLFIAVVFLLPFFVLVLHTGHKRWREQRSAAAMSHSDFFTYNMVAMEIISLAGYGLYCCGVYAEERALWMAGVYLYSITTPGQTMFHVLTCVERFLAVVYPVTYLELRQAGGVRIRNVCTASVWVCGALGMGVIEEIIGTSQSVFAFCFWIISLIFISFFSLTVVCVLIRPRPGDGERADQSKQRASTTILVILGVLMLRCAGFLSACVVFSLSHVSVDGRCLTFMPFTLLSLPSGLVLPLLFLQRAGKLPCCKQRPESVTNKDPSLNAESPAPGLGVSVGQSPSPTRTRV